MASAARHGGRSGAERGGKEQTAEAAPPEVPADLLAEEELQTGLRDLLQSSWDILTLKVVLAKLDSDCCRSRHLAR